MLRRLQHTSVAAIGGAIMLVHTSAAWADDVPNLHYEAPAGCSTQREFVAAVRRRHGDFEAPTHGGQPDAKRTWNVTITARKDRFIGTLQVQQGGSMSSPRDVDGDTCSEVFNALAVVTALTLRQSPAEPSSEHATAELAHPTPAESLPELTDAAEPSQRAPVEEAAPASKPRPQEFNGRSNWGSKVIDVPEGPLRLGPVFSTSVYLGGRLGPVPTVVTPQADFAFHMANFASSPGLGQRITGAVLRLRMSLPVGGSWLEASTTDYSIGVQSAGLGVCWSPHYNTRGLILLGCAELGVMFVNVNRRATVSSPWTENFGLGTAGLAAEAQYNLTSRFHIGGRVAFDGVVGRFVVENEAGDVLESLSRSGSAMLGAGVHF